MDETFLGDLCSPVMELFLDIWHEGAPAPPPSSERRWRLGVIEILPNAVLVLFLAGLWSEKSMAFDPSEALDVPQLE